VTKICSNNGEVRTLLEVGINGSYFANIFSLHMPEKLFD